MRVFQFDTDPVPAADAAAHADRDPGAALRRLAEICIEAHGIVAREGPAEMREPLEALLGRIGRQLGGEAEAEAEQAGR
jgi:hypothetical protein